MRYTQRFRLPLFDGAGSCVLPITWTAGEHGGITVESVGVTRRENLPRNLLLYAAQACAQRMAEHGEHRDEP